MFRVLNPITNTHKYFDHIVYAKDYCMKSNGKVDICLEGIIDNNYEPLYNKYVVVSDKFDICNTLEEAMQLKDKYILNAPALFAINIAKIDANLNWESYTNPIYDGVLFE